jgi:hypothetical protein
LGVEKPLYRYVLDALCELTKYILIKAGRKSKVSKKEKQTQHTGYGGGEGEREPPAVVDSVN